MTARPQVATATLRRAGVWSMADIDLPPVTVAPKITMEMYGTFCSGDRRRLVYRLFVDGKQLGTAVCWTAGTMWPWGLTIAHARIVNFGFKSRQDLMEAVEQFVLTGGSHNEPALRRPPHDARPFAPGGTTPPQAVARQSPTRHADARGDHHRS
jgi:hypothetical protein